MDLVNTLVRITRQEIMGMLLSKLPFLSFLKGPLGFLVDLGVKFLLTKTVIGLNIAVVHLVAKSDGESLEKVRQIAIDLLKSEEATDEQIKEHDEEIIEKLRKLIRLNRTPIGSHSS